MSAPKLPDGLPPLPAGAVYLGRGKSFITPPDGFDGWIIEDGECEKSWGDEVMLEGTHLQMHYAARIDSHVACLNGHVCEPTKPTADSEAVVLVRKLADAMDRARDCLPVDGSGASDRVLTTAIKEAEAFLAREDKR